MKIKIISLRRADKCFATIKSAIKTFTHYFSLDITQSINTAHEKYIESDLQTINKYLLFSDTYVLKTHIVIFSLLFIGDVTVVRIEIYY